MALGGVPKNRGVITAGIFVNGSSAPTKVVRSRFKRMYPTNSNQGYMMVDQGKFNKTSFYQSAQIDDLDGIIVDGDNEGIMTAAIESSRSHPKLYFAK